MPDFLSVFERTLKAVRYGIFQASDNLAYLLEGLCCAPEESTAAEAADFLINEACPCGSPGLPKMACHRHIGHSGDHAYSKISLDSAASPQNAAVVAPSPKQGSDSGPAEIDAFPRVPAGPPQTCPTCGRS